MTEIILNTEQARIVEGATDAVVVRDGSGKLLGTIVPVAAKPPNLRTRSTHQIEELESRLDSNGPWYTTEQVLEHLDSLESK